MEGTSVDVGAGEEPDAVRASSESPDAAATQLYLDDSLDVSLAELCGPHGVGDEIELEDCPATQLYFEDVATHDEGVLVSSSELLPRAVSSANVANAEAHCTVGDITDNAASQTFSALGAAKQSGNDTAAHSEETQLYDVPDAVTLKPISIQPVQQSSGSKNTELCQARLETATASHQDTTQRTPSDITNNPAPQTFSTLATASPSSNEVPMHAEDTQLYEVPDASAHMPAAMQPLQQTSSIENPKLDSAQAEADAVSPPGLSRMKSTETSKTAAPFSTVATASPSSNDAALQAEDTQFYDVPDTATHNVPVQPVQQSGSNEHLQSNSAQAGTDADFPPGTMHMISTHFSDMPAPQTLSTSATASPSSNDALTHAEDTQLYDVPDAATHNMPIQPVQQSGGVEHLQLNSAQAGIDADSHPSTAHMTSTDVSDNPTSQTFSTMATANPSSNDALMHTEDTQLYDLPDAATHNVPMQQVQQSGGVENSLLNSAQAGTDADSLLCAAQMTSTDVSNNPAPQTLATLAMANPSSTDAPVHAEDTQLYEVPDAAPYNAPIQSVQQSAITENLQSNAAQARTDADSAFGTSHETTNVSNMPAPQTFSTFAITNPSSNDAPVHAEDTQLYDVPHAATHIVPTQPIEQSGRNEHSKGNLAQPEQPKTDEVSPPRAAHIVSTDTSNLPASPTFFASGAASQPSDDAAMRVENTQLYDVPDTASHNVPTQQVQQTSAFENPELGSAQAETDAISAPGTPDMNQANISNPQAPQIISALGPANPSSNDAGIHAEDAKLHDVPDAAKSSVPTQQLREISGIENSKLNLEQPETDIVSPPGTTDMNSTTSSDNPARQTFATLAAATPSSTDAPVHAEDTQLYDDATDAVPHDVPMQPVQQSGSIENFHINFAQAETGAVSLPGTTHMNSIDTSNDPASQTSMATANQTSSDVAMNPEDTQLYDVPDTASHNVPTEPIQQTGENSKLDSAQTKIHADSPPGRARIISTDVSNISAPQNIPTFAAANPHSNDAPTHAEDMQLHDVPEAAMHSPVPVQLDQQSDNVNDGKANPAEGESDAAFCSDTTQRTLDLSSAKMQHCSGSSDSPLRLDRVSDDIQAHEESTQLYADPHTASNDAGAEISCADVQDPKVNDMDGCCTVGSPRSTTSGDTVCYDEAEAAAAFSAARRVKEEQQVPLPNTPNARRSRASPTRASEVDGNARSESAETERYGARTETSPASDAEAMASRFAEVISPTQPIALRKSLVAKSMQASGSGTAAMEPADSGHGMPCTQVYGDEAVELVRNSAKIATPALESTDAGYRMECTQLYGDEAVELAGDMVNSAAPALESTDAELRPECTQLYGDEALELERNIVNSASRPLESTDAGHRMEGTQLYGEEAVELVQNNINFAASALELTDAEPRVECTQLYGDEALGWTVNSAAPLLEATDAGHRMECTQLYGDERGDAQDPACREPALVDTIVPTHPSAVQNLLASASEDSSCTSHDSTKAASASKTVEVDHRMESTQMYGDDVLDLQAAPCSYDSTKGATASKTVDEDHCMECTQMYGDDVPDQQVAPRSCALLPTAPSVLELAGDRELESTQMYGADLVDLLDGSGNDLPARAEDNLEEQPIQSDNKQRDHIEREVGNQKQTQHKFGDEGEAGLQAEATKELAKMQPPQSGNKHETGDVKEARIQAETTTDQREVPMTPDSLDHEASKEKGHVLQVDGAMQSAVNAAAMGEAVSSECSKQNASEADGIGLQASTLEEKAEQVAMGSASHTVAEEQNIDLQTKPANALAEKKVVQRTGEDKDHDPNCMLVSSKQETNLLHAAASAVSAKKPVASCNAGEQAGASIDVERASLASPQKVTARVQTSEETLMSTPTEQCRKKRRSMGGGGQDAAASSARSNGSCSRRRSPVPDTAAASAPASKRRSGPPRLSLLLPKRRRASGNYGSSRASAETPSGYDAASSALWGGRTPKKAAPPPSLQVYLAAKQEELDESVTEVLAIPSIATPVRGDTQNPFVTSPVGSPPTAASSPFFGHGRNLLSVKQELQDSQRRHRGTPMNTIPTKVEIPSPRTRAQRLGLKGIPSNHPAGSLPEPGVPRNTQQLATEPSESKSTEQNRSAQRTRQRSESPPSPAWLKDACFASNRRQVAGEQVQSRRACEESRKPPDLAPVTSNSNIGGDNSIISHDQLEPKQRSQSSTPAWLKEACFGACGDDGTGHGTRLDRTSKPEVRQQEQHKLDGWEEAAQDVNKTEPVSIPAWLKDIQSQAGAESTPKHLNIAANELPNSQEMPIQAQASAWWGDSCFQRDQSQFAREQSNLELACEVVRLQKTNPAPGNASFMGGRDDVVGCHDRQDPQKCLTPPAWLKAACLESSQYHKIDQHARLDTASSSEAGLGRLDQQSTNGPKTAASDLDAKGRSRSPTGPAWLKRAGLGQLDQQSTNAANTAALDSDATGRPRSPTGPAWLENISSACRWSEVGAKITSSNFDNLSKEGQSIEDSTWRSSLTVQGDADVTHRRRQLPGESSLPEMSHATTKQQPSSLAGDTHFATAGANSFSSYAPLGQQQHVQRSHIPADLADVCSESCDRKKGDEATISSARPAWLQAMEGNVCQEGDRNESFVFGGQNEDHHVVDRTVSGLQSSARLSDARFAVHQSQKSGTQMRPGEEADSLSGNANSTASRLDCMGSYEQQKLQEQSQSSTPATPAWLKDACYGGRESNGGVQDAKLDKVPSSGATNRRYDLHRIEVRKDVAQEEETKKLSQSPSVPAWLKSAAFASTPGLAGAETRRSDFGASVDDHRASSRPELGLQSHAWSRDASFEGSGSQLTSEQLRQYSVVRAARHQSNSATGGFALATSQDDDDIGKHDCKPPQQRPHSLTPDWSKDTCHRSYDGDDVDRGASHNWVPSSATAGKHHELQRLPCEAPASQKEEGKTQLQSFTCSARLVDTALIDNERQTLGANTRLVASLPANRSHTPEKMEAGPESTFWLRDACFATHQGLLGSEQAQLTRPGRESIQQSSSDSATPAWLKGFSFGGPESSELGHRGTRLDRVLSTSTAGSQHELQEAIGKETAAQDAEDKQTTQLSAGPAWLRDIAFASSGGHADSETGRSDFGISASGLQSPGVSMDDHGSHQQRVLQHRSQSPCSSALTDARLGSSISHSVSQHAQLDGVLGSRTTGSLHDQHTSFDGKLAVESRQTTEDTQSSSGPAWLKDAAFSGNSSRVDDERARCGFGMLANERQSVYEPKRRLGSSGSLKDGYFAGNGSQTRDENTSCGFGSLATDCQTSQAEVSGEQSSSLVQMRHASSAGHVVAGLEDSKLERMLGSVIRCSQDENSSQADTEKHRFGRGVLVDDSQTMEEPQQRSQISAWLKDSSVEGSSTTSNSLTAIHASTVDNEQQDTRSQSSAWLQDTCLGNHGSNASVQCSRDETLSKPELWRRGDVGASTAARVCKVERRSRSRNGSARLKHSAFAVTPSGADDENSERLKLDASLSLDEPRRGSQLHFESNGCGQNPRLEATHIRETHGAWDAGKSRLFSGPSSLMHEALPERAASAGAESRGPEFANSAMNFIHGRTDDDRDQAPQQRSRSPTAAWLKNACYGGLEPCAARQGATIDGASSDPTIGRCQQPTHSDGRGRRAGTGDEHARAMSSQLLSAADWKKDAAFVGGRCEEANDSFSFDRVLGQNAHWAGSAAFITGRVGSNEQQEPQQRRSAGFIIGGVSSNEQQEPQQRSQSASTARLQDASFVDRAHAGGEDARNWQPAIGAFGGASNQGSLPDEALEPFNVRRVLKFDDSEQDKASNPCFRRSSRKSVGSEASCAEHDRLPTPCRRSSRKSVGSEASCAEYDRVPTPCRRSSRRSLGSEASLAEQGWSAVAQVDAGVSSSVPPMENLKQVQLMSAQAETNTLEKPVGLSQPPRAMQGPHVRPDLGIQAPQEARKCDEAEATDEDDDEEEEAGDGEILRKPAASVVVVGQPRSSTPGKELNYCALPMSQEPAMSQESELNVFAAPVDTQETQEFTDPKPEETEQLEDMHHASLSPGLTNVSMKQRDQAGTERATASDPDCTDEVHRAHAHHACRQRGEDMKQVSPGRGANETIAQRAAYVEGHAQQSNLGEDEAEGTEDEVTEDDNGDGLVSENEKHERAPKEISLHAPDDAQDEAPEEEETEDETEIEKDPEVVVQQSEEQAGEEGEPTRANASAHPNQVLAAKPKRNRVKEKQVASVLKPANGRRTQNHSEESHAENDRADMSECHMHEMWGEPPISPGSSSSRIQSAPPLQSSPGHSIEAAAHETKSIAAEGKVRTAAKSRPKPSAGQGKAQTATKSGPVSKHASGKGSKRGSPGSAWQRPLPASLGGPKALDLVRDAPAVAAVEQFATAPSDQAYEDEDVSGHPEEPPALSSCMGDAEARMLAGDVQPQAAKPAAAKRTATRKAGAVAKSAATEVQAVQSMEVAVPSQPIEDQVAAALASDDDSDAPMAPKKRRRATAPAKLAAPALSKSAVAAAKKKPKPTAAKSSAKKKSAPCSAAVAGRSGSSSKEASLALADVGQAVVQEEDCQPSKKRKGRATKAPAAKAAKGAKTSKDERPSGASAGSAADSGVAGQDMAIVPYVTPELAIVAHGVVAERVTIPDSSYSSVVEAAVAAAAGRPVFATTGFELSSRQKRLLLELGCVLVADWCEHITHLIADTFRRTTKMMCAICKGAYVLTPHFIKACREAGRLVSEAPFVLKDEVCEAAFARKRGIAEGYSLAQALVKSRQQGALLKGVSVYCFASVTDKRELPQVVAAAGGTWLTRLPASPNDSSRLLLLAERAGLSSDRENQRRKALEVYDVELIREAACTQELRRSAYRLR